MTQFLHPVSTPGIDAKTTSIVSVSETLVDLADAWLSAEVISVLQPGRADLGRVAGARAGAYEEAVAAASAEDVRLAWESARARQARHAVGSAPWRAAFRLSELLRFESMAMPTNGKRPTT